MVLQGLASRVNILHQSIYKNCEPTTATEFIYIAFIINRVAHTSMHGIEKRGRDKGGGANLTDITCGECQGYLRVYQGTNAYD